MAVQCSPSMARRWALGLAGAALALLGGCVAVPVAPYEVGAPVAYPDAVYSSPYYYGTPYYYGAVPYYYGRPYYGGPSLSLGIYGRSGSGHHWRGPRGGDRHWRSPGRPGGNWERGGGFRDGNDGASSGRGGGGRR